jgi:hypothetical protein
MPKYLIVFFLLGLISCTPDKKLSGTYVCDVKIRRADRQVIDILTDSTLQCTYFGNKSDSASGSYKIKSGLVLIIFDQNKIGMKSKFSLDSMPILHLYPPYSDDTMRWQLSFDILHHKLIGKDYTIYKKKGYRLGEGNMWYKDYTFYKLRK